MINNNFHLSEYINNESGTAVPDLQLHQRLDRPRVGRLVLAAQEVVFAESVVNAAFQRRRQVTVIY